MEKSTKKLKDELGMRLVKKENSYNIVGSEIKDRRLTLSRTLSSISNNICSVSYLCKIENNRIIPNKLYLREICKKLDLKDSKVDVLMHLKVALDYCVKAFLCKDFEYIRVSYSKGKGLVNYKYKIIELIYYISIKELTKANFKATELLRLVATMSDNDLSIFVLFYGILSFYNQDFNDAIDNFNSLDLVRIYSIEISLLQSKYKFFSYFILNNSCCIFEYNRIIQNLFYNGYIEVAEEIHYIMGIYLLRGKAFSEYKRIFKLIRKASYRRSLSLLAKLIVSPYLRIKREWLENVEPFFYYLGLIKINPQEAANKIYKLNDLSFNVDFNLLYLQYYLLPDDKTKYSFIIDVVIPTICKTQDGYAKEFFLDELSRLCYKTFKYKGFVDAYDKLKRSMYDEKDSSIRSIHF